MSLYYKFMSNWNDSYGSLVKRIYEEGSVIKIVMKLHDKWNVNWPNDGFGFQLPQIFKSSLNFREKPKSLLGSMKFVELILF